jgi:hypothetical protein
MEGKWEKDQLECQSCPCQLSQTLSGRLVWLLTLMSQVFQEKHDR